MNEEEILSWHPAMRYWFKTCCLIFLLLFFAVVLGFCWFFNIPILSLSLDKVNEDLTKLGMMLQQSFNFSLEQLQRLYWFQARVLELKNYIEPFEKRLVYWLGVRFLALGVFIWLILLIKVKRITYTLTRQRLIKRIGLIAKLLEEIELHRIVDFKLYQNVGNRLLWVGKIWIYTAYPEKTKKEMLIFGVVKPEEVKEKIRSAVYARREEMKLRPIEALGLGE